MQNGSLVFSWLGFVVGRGLQARKGEWAIFMPCPSSNCQTDPFTVICDKKRKGLTVWMNGERVGYQQRGIIMSQARDTVDSIVATAKSYQDKFSLVMNEIEGHLYAAKLHHENGESNLTVNRDLQRAKQLIQELKNMNDRVGVA